MNNILKEKKERLILATVGLCGVGKSEASRFLGHRMDTEVVYFGGIVSAEIRRHGHAQNPESEKVFREQLRRQCGEDIVARLALPSINNAITIKGSVVVDGLYSFAEYKLLKETFGSDLVVVALHSAREIRYSRLAARPERPFSRDEVDARDLHEVQQLDKAPPIALADRHVMNEDSIHRLHEALDSVLRSCGVPISWRCFSTRGVRAES